MPLVYQQDDVERRVTVTPRGVVTLEDALDALRQQIAGEAWTYGTLYDGRGRQDSLTPHEVRRLSNFIERESAALGPIGPLAILAPANVTFGMGRLFELVSTETRQIAVVRDLEVARGWLQQQQRQPPARQAPHRRDEP